MRIYGQGGDGAGEGISPTSDFVFSLVGSSSSSRSTERHRSRPAKFSAGGDDQKCFDAGNCQFLAVNAHT